MWSPLGVVALAGALAAGLAAVPARAVDSFSDSTFDTSSAATSLWELVYPAAGDPPPPSCLALPAPAGAPSPENQCSQSAGGASSDGDGNAFHGFFAIDSTPTVALLGAHLDASASYDPSVEGAIQSVNVRFKLRHDGSNAIQGSSGLEARAARGLVVQNGAYYTTSFEPGVVSRSEDALPAESFSAFSGALFPGQLGRIVAPNAPLDLTDHPDFSSSGAPLHFGFVVSVSWITALPPGGVYETSFLVDEFSFEVDGDADGDLVADPLDNCTQVSNPDQGDGDGNLCGNACDGDCNGDGIGGGPDLLSLGMDFGMSCSVPCACDRNFDGVVGGPDLFIVAREMGSVPGPSGLVGGGNCSGF